MPGAGDAEQVSSTGVVSRLLTVATVRRSTGHGPPYQVEVVIIDLEDAEPELVAPALLVLDEVQIVDEWANRRLIAVEEVDIPAPGHEVRARFHLIWLIVGDLPDGGERLERLAAFECGLGRIKDDEVAPGHRTQHVRLTVVGLREAAAHALLDVVAADGV